MQTLPDKFVPPAFWGKYPSFGAPQTTYINTGRPWPPPNWEDGPNGIGPGGVIVPVASNTPTARAGSQGAVPGPVPLPQSGPALMVFLGADGKVAAYDRASGISYPLT